MKYCPECGNQLLEGVRYCSDCGQDLSPSPGIAASRLPLELVMLAAGGMLGIASLFLDWTAGDGKVWDYIRVAFGDQPERGGPVWWVGVIAVGAFAGVAITVLLVVRALVRRELPKGWRVLLGGGLMGLAPLLTHCAAIARGAVVYDWSVGDFFEAVWVFQSAGIWIALAGGIMAVLSTRIDGWIFKRRF